MSTKGSFKASWCDLYRWSMRQGLEYCRICKINTDLTFDHIIPHAFGGANTRNNLTILCADCNNTKGTNYYDWLPPLSESPPAGWTNVPISEIKLGDFTLAGTIVEIGMWIPTRQYYFKGINPPFPNRRKSFDVKLPTVPVFRAEIKELINA